MYESLLVIAISSYIMITQAEKWMQRPSVLEGVRVRENR